MQVTLRCLVGLTLATLLPVLNAQESSVCRNVCETHKQQCRTGTAQGATVAGLMAAGVAPVALGQAKVFETPSVLDKQRDMRDVLDARQRATTESQAQRRAVDDQCNSGYMRCVGTCVPESVEAK